jgi:hypothetical protein
MTSVSHTQPAPRSHLRAYLAGTGATTVLIAAALIAFLSLAAFLAFKGLPFGGSGSERGNAFLGSQAGAPEAAATALAAATGAVAAAPVPGAPVGLAAVNAGGPRGDTTSSGPNGTTGSTGPLIPGLQPAPGGGGDAGRAITGTVQNLDQATSSLGLGGNLSGTTGPLTRPLDDTVNQTLNGVGGAVGQPGLGDDVGRTVNQITGRLLGN